MKILLTIWLLLFSSMSWASGSIPENNGSCSVNGNSDFTVYFDIHGWFYPQGIELQQPGSHADFSVLSTSRSLAAEMYDTALYRNLGTLRRYNAAISYDASTGRFNYYRKLPSSTHWGAPIDSNTRTLHYGNINVIAHLVFSSNMSCTDSLPSFARQYSDDPIYEFGTATCNGGNCDIAFNKEYDITPLVFVMPTIDAEKADSDMPATLSITSVTKSGASIVQETPPRIMSGSTEPITVVSYLAIEPGVADFNGHKVYADYADISRVSTHSSVNMTTVNFSQIPGFTTFSSMPTVLGQVQSRNNDDKWITTAMRSASRDSVQMSLELSHSYVSSHYYLPEKVAFLASEPYQGSVGVYQVEFSHSHSTLDSFSSGSYQPIKDACDVYATTSFDTINGIIANKQTRNGDDGGWLRRCDIDGSRVSFVVEEDTTGSSRRHISEQVGYFAFSAITPSLGSLCPYFPQPAQSWKNDSKLELRSSKSDQYEYHIGGWSEEYIDGHLSNGQLAIGFNHVINPYTSNETCEAGTCNTGGDKARAPADVNPSFTSDKSLDIGNWNYATECPLDNSNRYCRYEEAGAGSNDIVIVIKDHLKQLKVMGQSRNKKFIVRFDSKSGNDGLKIEQYETNQHVISQFNNAGIYTFKKVIFNTQTELHTGSDIVWRIQEEVKFSNSVDFYNTGITDDFIIFGPQAKVEFDSRIVNPYYGLILADTVVINNDVTIFGAVTANELTMNTSKATIVGESECFDPPVDDSYVIDVTEENEFALLCETPEFTFTVRNSETGEVADDFDGNVLVSLPSNLDVDEVITGSGREGTYQPDNGIVVLALASSDYGLYTIEGELDTGESDSSVLYVAPYAFEADTVYAVAGKDANVNIELRACKNDHSETVSSYSGDKTIRVSDMSLSSPSLTEGAIEGDLLVNDNTVTSSTDTNMILNFSAGVGRVVVNYNESGKMDFLLSDDDFDCPAGFDCEDEDEELWDGLQGSVNINFRPWTFAICEPNNLSINGTSSSGSGYTAAGDAFTLNVKPIVYTSDGTTDQQERCSANVTKNFFNNNAQAAIVYLRGELSSPSSGTIGSGSDLIIKDDAGNIISVGETLAYTSNGGTIENPWYEFSGLYWNEVGSLTVSADINDITESGNNQYLGMVIETGSREVGRFYPHHLTIIEESDTIWDYADGHDDFAYMGQEIGHDFIIQAESSRVDSDGDALITTNYGLFTDDNISTITYKVTINTPNSEGSDYWLNVESSRIYPSALQWLPSEWGDRSGQIDVENNDFSFVKDGAILEGPFSGSNANFGLVSNRIDTVDFNSLDFDAYLTGTLSGKRFANQPVFRYGRAVLSDVGGNQGEQISIPLKVEYWDGEQFVTNVDDNGSVLNSSEYCSQSIWSEIGNSTNVSLGGASTDSTVSQGRFSGLFAQQTSAGREQYKVWLRQGVSKTSESNANCSSTYVDQPWLKYYWNGASAAEDDPSATVTFGIYRGNDRVIFRGENRFTGQ